MNKNKITALLNKFVAYKYDKIPYLDDKIGDITNIEYSDIEYLEFDEKYKLMIKLKIENVHDFWAKEDFKYLLKLIGKKSGKDLVMENSELANSINFGLSKIENCLSYDKKSKVLIAQGNVELNNPDFLKNYEDFIFKKQDINQLFRISLLKTISKNLSEDNEAIGESTDILLAKKELNIMTQNRHFHDMLRVNWINIKKKLLM